MCVRAGTPCLLREIVRTGKRTPRKRAAAPSVSQDVQTAARSYAHQRSGASSSAVGFAVNIFGEYAASHSEDISSIPGHAAPSDHSKPDWTLKSMSMPPATVMSTLLTAYFEHVHWFIFIFHEDEAMRSITPLLYQSTWPEQFRGRVITALTMAALGLQSVMHDKDWPGHPLLASSSLEASQLRDNLIAEVQLHLFDLLEECSLEAAQVSVLLGTYYIYHGSPGLAWNILGLSVRTAYALSLHCESSVIPPDQVISQIRRRTWNHVTVADTFAAMVYGRPASLDTAFCKLYELFELEDTRLPPLISESLQDPNVTGLTFHMLKYRLYEIIRTGLNRFRLLNLQNPIPPETFGNLVDTILQTRASLETWRTRLPEIFQQTSWLDNNPQSSLVQANPGTPGYRTRRTLALQAQILLLTYDSAVIFINRPLLEYQVSPEHRATVIEHMPVAHESMDLCFTSALSISHTSGKDHENEFSISFVLMNYFTAGVILCLIPTLWPFSGTANEAKSGVLRIISASRNLRSRSQIAQHTEQLLTRLLKRSHEQELENGLRNAVPSTERQNVPISRSSPPTSPRPLPSRTNHPDTQGLLSPRQSQKGSTAPIFPNQPAMVAPIPDPKDPRDGYFSAPAHTEEFQDDMLYIQDSNRYYEFDPHVDEALGSFGQSKL